MTKVSIIIPVYNAVKSLPYLLADLQKQTYQDAEFIMVNDGSTDESAQVIADFIKKQSFGIFHCGYKIFYCFVGSKSNRL